MNETNRFEGGAVNDQEIIEEETKYERMPDTEAEIFMTDRGVSPAVLNGISEEYVSREASAGLQPIHGQAELIVGDLARLLVELKDDLTQYETIISDDSSARLPSLFFRKVINKKRRDVGMSEVGTFFISSGRHDSINIWEKISDFFNKKINRSSKVLVVTEFIETGRSIEKLVDLLEELRIDFDLAAVSISKNFLNDNDFKKRKLYRHLRYGEADDGGLNFYQHLGNGVVRANKRDKFRADIHPIKNETPQYKINGARENINYLADQLYPLVE